MAGTSLPDAEESKLLSITVWLSGRSYRIKVPAEHEGGIRAAVKAADSKIIEMRRQYAGRDDQDFMAMTLLLYAAESVISGGTPEVREGISEMLREVTEALG
jgi:cell division protein ZapA